VQAYGNKEKQKKPMTEQSYKEFGKWFMDISKYVITAILIGSFFKSFEDTNWIYLAGGVTATILLIAGLLLMNKK